MNARTPPTISNVRPAGEHHQVISLEGGGHGYRRRPCGLEVPTEERPGCPWRADSVGHFPPEAFVHSAETSYDMSERTFACHEAGSEAPMTCAGFLLRGAEHNLTVRVRVARGKIDPSQVTDGGHRLHRDYRTMAVANGVDPDHPALAPCRDLPEEN